MRAVTSPPRQYVMPCIVSRMTERTFVVLSRRLQQAMEDFFAQQGTALFFEEMRYNYSAPEDYERLERALRQISDAVGIPQVEGEGVIHILEAAAMRLQGKGFLTADEEAAI